MTFTARTQYCFRVFLMPADFTFVDSLQQLPEESISGEVSINIGMKQYADPIAFPLNIDFHNMDIYFSISTTKQASQTHTNDSYKFQISYQSLILLFICYALFEASLGYKKLWSQKKN